MADDKDTAWPLMMEFVAARINPAMLEAYGSDEIPPIPSLPFFQKALETLRSAQKALGSSFEQLSMEQKIALLDFLDALGPDEAAKKLKMVDKSSEDTVLQSFTSTAAQPESRLQRAIDSLLHSRLVFPESTSINKLRDGALELRPGTSGPAVRYLHRLLQVAQRVLKTQQIALKEFDSFKNETITALKVFEAKAFQKAQQLQNSGLSLGRYALAVLETVVHFDEAPKTALIQKDDPGMLIFGQQEHLIKVKVEDFAEYMVLRQKLWHANTPGSDDPALGLTLGEGDLKRFKYLVAYIQSGYKQEIARLKDLAERALAPLKKSAKDFWDNSSLGRQIALICGAAGLVGYSAWKSLEGKASSFDETVVAGTGALLKGMPIKIFSPKKDGPLLQKRIQWTAKGEVGASKLTFYDAIGEDTIKKFTTLGASTTFILHKKKSDKVSVEDTRVWYCENTCRTYLTREVQELLQSKELTLEDTVVELSSAEPKQLQLSQIPAFADSTLYSTEQALAVTVEGKTEQYKGQEFDPFQLKVKLTWEKWKLETSATSLFDDKKHPVLKDPDDPTKSAKNTVSLRILEAKLARTLAPSWNTSKRSQTVDLWAAIKNSKEFSPVPSLSKETLSYSLGAGWTATREGNGTIKISLSGSMHTNQLSEGSDPAPDAHLHMEVMKKQFTLYLDTKVKMEKDPKLADLSLRFFYNLGHRR
ncbi:MAG TPA: hypothetical protein VF815_07230 [Myxococcaceae bacterium]